MTRPDMTESAPYPPATPVPVDIVDGGPATVERALAMVFHIFGTVAAMVFLYVVYVLYVAVGELQDQMQHISDTFGGVGG